MDFIVSLIGVGALGVALTGLKVGIDRYHMWRIEEAMRNHAIWEQKTFEVSIFPKLHLKMTCIISKSVFNTAFFETDERRRSLNLGVQHGVLLEEFTPRTALIARVPQKILPSHYVRIIFKISNGDLEITWNAFADPDRPLITDRRAIIIMENEHGNLELLAIRAGSECHLNYHFFH